MAEATDRPARPVILAVIADDEARHGVADALDGRYGRDYRIVATGAADAAVVALDDLRASGQVPALLIADRMAAEDGVGLFRLARSRFAEVRRCLLIDWGAWADPEVAEAVFRLVSTLQIDYYAVRPLRSPDEAFHRRITDFLLEWERSMPSGPSAVTVIGRAADPRTHQIAAQLARFGIRYDTLEPGSHDAVELLSESGEAAQEAPLLRLVDGRIVEDPTDAELARAFAFSTDVPRQAVDVAIIGAGPGGLAAAVYAASEGLDTLVLERASIGGQAGSSSLIRNYLGFERGVSGAELAQRSYQQAWVFGARFALTREAVGLEEADGAFRITVAPGEHVVARSVVLATGVSYRRIDLADLAPYVGTAVFYGASAVEARAQSGRIVHVVGGGNSAGQAALHLARYAASVSLILRGTSLAESMSAYLIDQLRTAGVGIITESRVVGGTASPDRADRLESIVLRSRTTGDDTVIASDALFITIGAVPHTTWLPDEVLRDKWGFVISGSEILTEGGRRAWPGERDPGPLESSVPGLFVVGDARRGSVKRVASAVGEGSVVVSAVHAFLAERAEGHDPARPAG